jgi:phenol hydroxylase P0 protein
MRVPSGSWHGRCNAPPVQHRNLSSQQAPSGSPVTAPACDYSLKYVRVTEERADGLVAFDFSIGWPELSVELMLPRAAFEEFCATNRVTRLAAPTEDAPPVDNSKETDE